MIKREVMQAILNHEENIVPSWTMAFFNVNLAQNLLGEENVVTDFIPIEKYKFGGSTKENQEKNIKYSEAIDNFSIGVGKGANFAFGHGGPGEFMDKIIEKNNDFYISKFETGVQKKTNLSPHFYHHFNYPISSLSNHLDVELPNPNDSSRYIGIKDEIDFYKKNGYMTHANVNGIFSGIHYFLYPYDELFLGMYDDPDNLKAVIKRLKEFNLTVCENMLKAGVDIITFCDDLGDGQSLLFSPDMLDEYFIPYYRELSNLCHSYNGHLHMHSHGNIVKIIPKLIDAGIDMLNPLDPYEVGDFKDIKEAFGDKITLVGGMDKFFFEWDNDKIKEYLTYVINIGRKNGGFILMDSGGIPENISKEKFDFIIETSKTLRYKKD